MTYHNFLASKRIEAAAAGIARSADDLHPKLFPFQRTLVAWALGVGRCALFASTGLGKTLMQVEWARSLDVATLILAPLCVSEQTIREAQKIGVTVNRVGGGGIEITNYERLHQVDPERYGAVVLDESSILKSIDGVTKRRLTEMFAKTPYRLCCTATPAPNDTAELANHAEFLGIMRRAELLATFFVHDENGWRLRGHARRAFWRFLTSWAMFLRFPSDLGFEDDGFILPRLDIRDITEPSGPVDGALFHEFAVGGIRGRLSARRGSLTARVQATSGLVKSRPGPWIIWCGLNEEQRAIERELKNEVASVYGAQSPEEKTELLLSFLRGNRRVLLTKPSIAGFGLNLQHCHQMVFLGLSDSFEEYFQCIRRCWRFGQTESVTAHIVVGEAERAVVDNVRAKEREATAVADETMREAAGLERVILSAGATRELPEGTETFEGECWRVTQGDAVEVLPTIQAATVDLSIFSPPFLSLYTYTASGRDIGNCRTDEEFLAHFGFVVQELIRVTRPGRLACVHVAQVPTTLVNQGVIGLKDFRGRVIDLFIAHGWIYHGEFTIPKNPQAQAIRTHAKALLFAQLRKDASWLRPALLDFVLLFRAPGTNLVPIKPDITNEEWIQWASGVWNGIKESDTLGVSGVRDSDDDRHVCPLQLGVIERCVRLWSNPGELVLSPFAGIGSEGYESVRLGRRFLGIELKPNYARAAVKNLQAVERVIVGQGDLFARSSGDRSNPVADGPP